MEEELVFLMDQNDDISAKLLISSYLNTALTFSPFISAFFTSYCLIIVNELGDKTFFIAAVLAMKRGAFVTFIGSGCALVLMTLVSALAGRTLPALMNPKYTHYASVALFICFGGKLLYEAYNMPDDCANSVGEGDSSNGHEIGAGHMMQEIELELASNKHEATVTAATAAAALDNLEKGGINNSAKSLESRTSTGTGAGRSSSAGGGGCGALLTKTFIRRALVSAAFTEAFTMTFAAEWGDRSQIATLALGASKNIVGVNLGAMAAHLTCTALAVFGGRMLVQRLSEKTISVIGGMTFLVFAFAGIFIEGFS